MRLPIALLASLAIGAPTSAALAAVRPAPPPCPVARDSVGDATGLMDPVSNPRNDDNMDFTQLAMSTDATSLTAEFRLGIFATFDSSAPTGRRFTFTYKLSGIDGPAIHVLVGADGVPVTDAPGGKTFFDDHTLKVTVPFKTKPKSVFTWMGGAVERWRGDLGGAAIGAAVDEVSGTVKYVHLSRACLTPVR